MGQGATAGDPEPQLPGKASQPLTACPLVTRSHLTSTSLPWSCYRCQSVSGGGWVVLGRWGKADLLPLLSDPCGSLGMVQGRVKVRFMPCDTIPLHVGSAKL